MNAKKRQEEPEPARTPIVINTTRGARIVPFGGVSDGGVGLIDMERMRFAPGMNAPKDADNFATVSAFPSYKRWVKEGVLQEICDVSEIPTIGNADERIIEASSSRSSMEWWMKQEQRSAVRKKLKAKIAEMRAPRAGEED